jgi:CubicO group peptidase (beta-lactamase class C family)
MISPEEVGLSSERLSRIRPAIQKHIGHDKIAGALTLLSRRGHVVHLDCVGLMDRECNGFMQPDTIFRIWSMTKPIVCVALMTLYEQGRFQLLDPVSKFIPAFRNLKVYAGEDESGIKVAELVHEVTIRDLLTHTSGFTYGFFEYGPVDRLYREKLRFGSEQPLADLVSELLTLPLAFQPGTSWRYGVSHDVVGYLLR